MNVASRSAVEECIGVIKTRLDNRRGDSGGHGVSECRLLTTKVHRSQHIVPLILANANNKNDQYQLKFWLLLRARNVVDSTKCNCIFTVRIRYFCAQRTYTVYAYVIPEGNYRVASCYIGVTTLTFLGHVTSSVTWSFDSQVAISYRYSIVTKSLYRAVSEIMGTKHIGVTTLTFQGHVDSGWVISCWWSFGPKSLSLTVSEIFRPKHLPIDTMLNRHCACAISRHVTCTPYVKFKYIFQFIAPTLPIHYAKSKNLWNFDLLGGLEIRGYEKLRFLLQKAHPCVKTRRSSHFAWMTVEGSDP